jgi:LysM repeat protein
MSYTIEQNFIQGLPEIPFRNGASEGIVNHCTDSPNHSGGDTPTNERNYEAGTFNSAFVHFFVGVENNQAKIEQVANTSFIAYGAGHTANQRYIHIELDMYDDANLFKIAYDAYVWLTAKLLADRKLGVSDKGSLWSHKEISDTFKETSHQDPISYLESHGISWTQHVANVTAQYNAMVATDHIPKTYVVQPSENLTVIAKKFGTTVDALEKLNGLTGTSIIKVGQILKISDTPTPTPTPASNPIIAQVKVIATSLNIREQPNPQSKILEVAPQGKVFNVTGNINDWHEVILDNNGHKGFAFGNNGKYLELVK